MGTVRLFLTSALALCRLLSWRLRFACEHPSDPPARSGRSRTERSAARFAFGFDSFGIDLEL
eukprot:96567-Prorocentrum_minimum.AAC.1